MTNVPLTNVELGNSPTETGRKRAREKDQANSKSAISIPSSSTPSDSCTVADGTHGSDITA
jgi:hypothetical protein